MGDLSFAKSARPLSHNDVRRPAFRVFAVASEVPPSNKAGVIAISADLVTLFLQTARKSSYGLCRNDAKADQFSD